jgi:hypothetical protein
LGWEVDYCQSVFCDEGVLFCGPPPNKLILPV